MEKGDIDQILGVAVSAISVRRIYGKQCGRLAIWSLDDMVKAIEQKQMKHFLQSEEVKQTDV